MKKLLALTMAAALSLSLVACGGGSGSAASDSTGGSGAADSSSSGDTGSGEIPTVSLTLWGGEEDQNLLREIADAFIELHKDEANITIDVGVQSESSAKDTVLTDIEAAADVYTFADDQILELWNAGALQEIQLNPDDIKSRNTEDSVAAATVDGHLCAYPLTADNGYFMFYDKSVFTEDDVQTLDRMMEVAAAAGKVVSMEVTSGWYTYSFFGCADDLYLRLADDGVTNECNWNTGSGPAIAQAIEDICANPGFMSQDDSAFKAGLVNGTVAAGVNGIWNANAAAEAWGDNYCAAKLPTFTVDGEQQQMASYFGYKLLGVNPLKNGGANAGWAMMLADYISNEENQIKRFEQRSQGPSNIAAQAGCSNAAIDALQAQLPYTVLQRVGGNYWDPVGTMAKNLVEGGNGIDVQKILDDAVDGITAPVVA